MRRSSTASYTRLFALALAGLGTVVALFMFLVPSPSTSMGSKVIGATFGTPVTVDRGDDCDIERLRRRSGGTVVCPGAAWSVDGREESGTLYGRLEYMTGEDGMAQQVSARVFNGAAYAPTNPLESGVVTAAVTLIGLGLLVVVGTLLPWPAVTRGKWISPAQAAKYDVFTQQPERMAEAPGTDLDAAASEFDPDAVLIASILLATALMAGLIAAAVSAQKPPELLFLGALAVGDIWFVVIRVRKWRNGG
jgi:hypothetical protein